MLSETLWSRLQHTDDKLTIRQDTYNAFPKITLSKSSNNDIILIVDIFLNLSIPNELLAIKELNSKVNLSLVITC